VRCSALLLVALVLAGCGAGGGSEFGDVRLVLPAKPSANDLGVYFAGARGYDEALGVTLRPQRRGSADFRIVAKPSRGCVAVMAVVRPAKLVLCVDPFILHDQRAAVVRALSRGYTQAQLEPDEAVAAMAEAVPRARAARLSSELDKAAATWTEGARYFGQLAPGPNRDPSVAADAHAN
jgi:hypothetical protein